MSDEEFIPSFTPLFVRSNAIVEGDVMEELCPECGGNGLEADICYFHQQRRQQLNEIQELNVFQDDMEYVYGLELGGVFRIIGEFL